MNLLDRAAAALAQGKQYAPALMTIPGQQVGKTSQGEDYAYQMPTWLYDAAGPNAIGQAQAAGSTAGFGGYGGAMTQSGNTIGGKNLYAARSPYQDMQGYTDGRKIYVRDPATPGAWLSYDASSPQAKAALQGKNSALNGTAYNVIDANGNVIGQRTFTGLKDQDHVNDAMMAVAGAALGGMAAFGGAAAGGAGAASGAGGAAGVGAAEGAGTFGVGMGTGTATGGLGYGFSAPTFGGASIGSGIDFGAAAGGFGGGVAGAGMGGSSGGGVTGLADGSSLDAAYGGLDGGATLGGGGSLGAGGSAVGAGVPPPANPYNWRSYLDAKNLANLATSSDGLSTIGQLGLSAVGAMGGGGDVPDLTGDEAARQAKQQAAIDAINERFGYGTSDSAKSNKTTRDSMYSDISGAVSEAAMRDLNKQFTTASNRNTFGLARSGLMGGSVDAESGGDLQERYGEGKMKATQQGLGAASDLRSQDEQTRQRLVSLAQSGLDVGTANSMAASEMQSAADSAKANAAGSTVGRLFDDMSQAYAMNGYLKARYPNGTAPGPASYSSNLFGTNRYTGRVQG